MDCFGWAKIQASHSCYVGAKFEELDSLDDEVDRDDRLLFAECRKWLREYAETNLKWQFNEQLNWGSGFLQFQTQANHRASAIWDLAEFIARQSKGSYGLIYVHDDEDSGQRTGGNDYSLSFRVWRILDGELREFDDHFFSPFRSPHAFGGMGGFGE